jgi:hypothetical protein
MMKEGTHARVMNGLWDGSMAHGGTNTVWTPHRINPGFLRCPACGAVTRGPVSGQTCRCGAPLPEPLPYW